MNAPKVYPVTTTHDSSLVTKHNAKVTSTSPSVKAAHVAKAKADASSYASQAKGLAKS
jgi:hypothetical protein